jgi:hypothetical protein
MIRYFRLDDIAEDTADDIKYVRLVLVRGVRVRTLHEGHIYVADPKKVNCMRWAMLTDGTYSNKSSSLTRYLEIRFSWALLS